MNYYGNPKLDGLKSLIDSEVRRGVNSLSASYLSNKYDVAPALVQRVLSDLVAAGDLSTQYQLLCSGEHQRYDIDREFTQRSDIPSYEITCERCGDHYVPDDENILVFFEPTEDYLHLLAQHS